MNSNKIDSHLGIVFTPTEWMATKAPFSFILSGLLHHRLSPPGVHAQEVERAQQQAPLLRQAVQPRPQEGNQRPREGRVHPIPGPGRDAGEFILQ